MSTCCRALILALALAAPLGLSACSREALAAEEPEAPKAPPKPLVVVADVTRDDVPVVRTYVARTEARDTVVVEARVEAILEEMDFEEGRRVSQGDVLYRLDKRTYEANLSAAQARQAKAEADLKLANEQVSVRAAEAAVDKAVAALGKAQQDVARLRPLAEQDAVPRQDLDTAVAAEEVAAADLAARQADLENSRIMEEVAVLQAEAELQGAQADVALAQLDLDYCTIECPIDGLIGRTMVDVGNLVGRGGSSELVTVSSIDPMRVTMAISEAEFLNFQRQDRDRRDERNGDEEGTPVTLLQADDSEYEYEGHIVTAERAVAVETGTLQLVAEFPNPEGILRPGQFGRIRASVGLLEDAVLVPQRAVMEQQSAKVVYVVDDADKVSLRTVTVSERFGDKFVVLDGLDGGERVVIEGQLKARPGMTVQVGDAVSAEPDAGGGAAGDDATDGDG